MRVPELVFELLAVSKSPETTLMFVLASGTDACRFSENLGSVK